MRPSGLFSQQIRYSLVALAAQGSDIAPWSRDLVGEVAQRCPARTRDSLEELGWWMKEEIALVHDGTVRLHAVDRSALEDLRIPMTAKAFATAIEADAPTIHIGPRRLPAGVLGRGGLSPLSG